MAVNIQLKDFAPKASPVPADLVYSANSADSFNEVKITIAQLISAYPGLASIGGLTTAANEIIYTTAADTYAVAPITTFGLSVIALAAGVTTPTAGALATWDASVNLSANNFLPGFTSTPTAAGTTVLTVASDQIQEFTGSTTQTVTMPVTSTLVAGTPYRIINNSSGAVTVNSSGGNAIQVMAAGSQLDLICILISGTTAASWQASYVIDSAGLGNYSFSGNTMTVSSGNMLFTLPSGVLQISSATDTNFNIISSSATGMPYLNFLRNSVTQIAAIQAGTNSTGGASANGMLYYNAISNGQHYFFSGTAGTFFTLDPVAGSVLALGNFTLSVGSIFATLGGYASGSAAGGYQGTFQAYSTTAALGSIALIAADNAGNYANVLTNLATNAVRTWSLPDASGTIALVGGSASLSYNSVAGTTQAAAAGNAYILNNAGATTVTLPTTGASTIGDTIKIKGRSAAPWIIQANTGQIITDGAVSSSTAGTATSALGTDSLQLVYVAANEWSVDWALSSLITLA